MWSDVPAASLMLLAVFLFFSDSSQVLRPRCSPFSAAAAHLVNTKTQGRPVRHMIETLSACCPHTACTPREHRRGGHRHEHRVHHLRHQQREPGCRRGHRRRHHRSAHLRRDNSQDGGRAARGARLHRRRARHPGHRVGAQANLIRPAGDQPRYRQAVRRRVALPSHHRGRDQGDGGGRERVRGGRARRGGHHPPRAGFRRPARQRTDDPAPGDRRAEGRRDHPGLPGPLQQQLPHPLPRGARRTRRHRGDGQRQGRDARPCGRSGCGLPCPPGVTLSPFRPRDQEPGRPVR